MKNNLQEWVIVGFNSNDSEIIDYKFDNNVCELDDESYQYWCQKYSLEYRGEKIDVYKNNISLLIQYVYDTLYLKDFKYNDVIYINFDTINIGFTRDLVKDLNSNCFKFSHTEYSVDTYLNEDEKYDIETSFYEILIPFNK